MTDAEIISRVMQQQGDVIAATAWDGFCVGGRGCVLTDGQRADYFSASLVAYFPPTIRGRVQGAVRAYTPEHEFVVLIEVPDEKQLLLAVIQRTPAFATEATHVG